MVTGCRNRDGNEHLSWNNEIDIVIRAVGSISLIKKELGFGLLQDLVGIVKGLNNVKM